MKTIRLIGYALFASLFLVQLGISQQRKAGLTGAAFLKIGVGARAVGLGSAVTAIPYDVNQMFWNPAGIALKDQRLQATFSYNKWFADLNHNTAAVSYNWNGVGTVGIGAVVFGLSDIPADRDIPIDPSLKQFQIEQNTSLAYDYRDIAVQLSFARYVMDKLSLGATVKLISQSIDGENVKGFGVDFGSVYHIGILNWTIGARFNNLGSDLKYNDIAFGLPLSFTIGTTMIPWDDGQNRIMFTADATKPQDGPQYLFAGSEATLVDILRVRAGYKINYSGTDDGGTSARGAFKNTIEGVSFGGGISRMVGTYSISVDYAYTQMDLVDAVHRVSVTIGFK